MQKLKENIARTLNLNATIGIGPNKLTAKLASEAGKPNGLYVLTPGKVDTFMQPLPLKDIPGIGRVSAAKFERRGMHTVKDARQLSWQELRQMFGTHGFTMYERLRGIDVRDVDTEDVPPLSIGKMHTFDEDVHRLRVVQEAMEAQAARIIRKMQRHGYGGFRTVVLTIRFEDFETHTRSVNFKEPRTAVRELELAGLKLLLPFFEKKENPRGKAIRLVGLRIEKLA